MKSSQLVTSTDYAHPRRLAAIRLANRLGAARRIEVEPLLDAARLATGLDDFGDPAFREPLAVLLDSVNREARLHPVGAAIFAGRVRTMLENRLRIEARIRRFPAIEAVRLRRPLVIAGLQRTGTTMLHRLLAADPNARSLASFEALHPVPLALEGEDGDALRRLAAKAAEEALRVMAPEFFAIHPVESDAPEEDILLLDHAFATQTPEATMHVPTYASYLEGIDHTFAYRYLARVLRTLDYARPRHHWVLKTPHHMEHLAALLAVFPDAVIIQTHRDPQATMGSFCSMVAHGRGVFSDDVDAREVGRHWLRKVGRMLDRSAAVRDGGHAASFVDVSYYDLLADPMREVERIYAHAGLRLDDAARAEMNHVLGRDVQNRYGVHFYRTRDFGLSPTKIDEFFAGYRDRFGVRHEKVRDHGAPERVAGASGVGHNDPISAALTGIYDLYSTRGFLPGLDDSVRLDGQTALVTGANTGLGFAIALDLAKRGADVVLACRSGIPEAGERIARLSGNRRVRMEQVDLADFDSIVALTNRLADSGLTIDLLVCNAGLVPSKAVKTKHGFEIMFAVHYLANHLLTHRLLASGVVPNGVHASNGRRGTAIPRIVFVSSEAHRSSPGLDLDNLGAFVDYGVKDGMAFYGHSKLALTTFATELARRLTTPSGPSVAVHACCPGPVASSIARDAPAPIRPLVDSIMKVTFRSPEEAAMPPLYLGVAPELAGDTGWYMHLMRRKEAAPWALDPENGRRLHEGGSRLLGDYLTR